MLEGKRMGLAEDWKEWAWRMGFLEDCQQSEIDELKSAIFEVWSDPEKRAYWEWRIADEANFSRELKAMGSEASQRMRATRKLEGVEE